MNQKLSMMHVLTDNELSSLKYTQNAMAIGCGYRTSTATSAIKVTLFQFWFFKGFSKVDRNIIAFLMKKL